MRHRHDLHMPTLFCNSLWTNIGRNLRLTTTRLKDGDVVVMCVCGAKDVLIQKYAKNVIILKCDHSSEHSPLLQRLGAEADGGAGLG